MAKIETSLKKRNIRYKKNLTLTAINAAKEENSPLYKKFVRFRKLWKLYRNKIIKKYGPKVKSRVLKNL